MAWYGQIKIGLLSFHYPLKDIGSHAKLLPSAGAAENAPPHLGDRKSLDLFNIDASPLIGVLEIADAGSMMMQFGFMRCLDKYHMLHTADCFPGKPGLPFSFCQFTYLVTLIHTRVLPNGCKGHILEKCL